MRKASTILTVLLAVGVIVSGAFASGELYPLLPKGKDKLVGPSASLDPIYSYSHVDDNAEYYLGSGAADDTFFIAFEPPAACSVKYVEVQWYDAGNVNAFAAWYSDDALSMYPDGTAPNRGTSPVSPVGTWIAGPVPNTIAATQDWETLDLGGAEFIVGNPATLESAIFGVGFIKPAESPHPLADNMSAKGLRFTYTWFGGPWNSGATYPWGAYSANIQTGTVIDVMMQIWVSYPWGMPILISELEQLPNTFDTAGPYDVTVKLLDDAPGITSADQVLLYYEAWDNTTLIAEGSVDLEPIAVGSDYFHAAIPGQAVGIDISYWVETTDDGGLFNTSLPKSFYITEPERPTADILFIDNGCDYRFDAFWWALDELGYYAENWSVDANMGIDGSVINHGWNTLLVAGWGVSSVPCLDEPTPYAEFLDNGGKMALIDQDWFYAQGLDPTGSFIAGDFAYDYMGIVDYTNDPDQGTADTTYWGVGGNAISNDWEGTEYETYWSGEPYMTHTSMWPDYFTEGDAVNIFFGDDGNSYGCFYDNGFKTVFLSFMADANCGYNENGWWAPTPDFTALIGNILDWFGTLKVDNLTLLSPSSYALNQNYPNPFNPATAISFVLPNAGKVSLKVFNMMGQEVATVINTNMNSGAHLVNFDASNLSSGVYYYTLKAGDFKQTKQMILVK